MFCGLVSDKSISKSHFYTKSIIDKADPDVHRPLISELTGPPHPAADNGLGVLANLMIHRSRF